MMPAVWPGGILVGVAMHAGAQATLLIGFLLGLRHATDLDHIVAVSTLVTEGADVRRGARIGLSWGTGHLLTVFAAGGLLILLRAIRLTAGAGSFALGTLLAYRASLPQSWPF
jgi:high-affinity nickel permease